MKVELQVNLKSRELGGIVRKGTVFSDPLPGPIIQELILKTGAIKIIESSDKELISLGLVDKKIEKTKEIKENMKEDTSSDEDNSEDKQDLSSETERKLNEKTSLQKR